MKKEFWQLIYCIGFITTLWSLSFQAIYAQSILDIEGPIRNPSFEGGRIGDPAGFWRDCSEAESTSNLQPGHAGVLLTPSNGRNYLGMVTRPCWSSSSSAQRCRERVNMPLLYPLSSDSCYRFEIDLSHSSLGYDENDRRAVLNIWGGNTTCLREELLWTSPVPSSFWQSYEVILSPSSEIQYLILEADYQEKDDGQGGHILMDYIRNFRAIPNFFTLDLGEDQRVCRKEDVLLDLNIPEGSLIEDIEWSDGSRGTSLNAQDEGVYWVEVNSGCKIQRDSIVITQDPCLFIPNAFTPNGDAYNQYFEIDGIQKGIWELLVYNRWGKLVYENRQYRNDWEGENLPPGVYTYLLYSPTYAETYRGWLEIIR